MKSVKSKSEKIEKSPEKIVLDVYNQNGEPAGKIELPPAIFGLKFNPDLVHQVLRAQMANSRQVSAHTKGRGEVRGGGKKPWRQKGTGRARHGSIRSPIWKGGGVTFGPTKFRNFTLKINKKMKQKALFMVLSQKRADDEIVFVDELKIGEPKTKIVASLFQVFKDKIKKDFTKGVLLVLPEKNENLLRAARNLPYFKTILADSLNVSDLLSFKYILIFQAAVELIKKTYSKI
ncbi:MAG: 50S ribosomal protein L4 [bacterium]|nr:50S ribosomal protein L4 [bacterium]